MYVECFEFSLHEIQLFGFQPLSKLQQIENKMKETA